MATTVLLALAGAFILSLTLVPVLTSYLVQARARSAHETWLLRKAARAVRAAACARAMRQRVGTLSAAACSLLAGAVGALHADRRRVRAAARRRRPAGRGAAPARRRAQRVGRRRPRACRSAIMSVPEVASVVSKTGAPELATDPMGIEQTDVYISLKDRDDVARGPDQGGAGERDQRGARARRARGRRRHLAADSDAHQRARRGRALGRGGAVLRTGSRRAAALGEQARAAPSGASRARSTCASSRWRACATCASMPDRAKLARYGLTIDDINQLTETLAVGTWRGRRARGRAALRHRGQDRARLRGDLAPLLALPLRSVSGQVVPLGDVAELELRHGPRADQPREPVAPHHRRVQRARSRPAVGGARRAGRGRRTRCALPDRLPRRVGRPVRALRGGARPPARAWCRSRSR